MISSSALRFQAPTKRSISSVFWLTGVLLEGRPAWGRYSTTHGEPRLGARRRRGDRALRRRLRLLQPRGRLALAARSRWTPALRAAPGRDGRPPARAPSRDPRRARRDRPR